MFILVYHSCYDNYLTDDPYRVYSEEDYYANRNSLYSREFSGTEEECQKEYKRLMIQRLEWHEEQELLCREAAGE